MAHNPIYGRYKIGTTDSFVIHENYVGLLYRNHRFTRKLLPGEAPTLSEKVAGKLRGQEIAVYVVDLRPTTYDWRVNLPALDDGDVFSTSIRLIYRVTNPERMVEDGVADTEALIRGYLETELRRISRAIPLHKHIQADTDFTDFINRQADLPGRCGLSPVAPADVQIYLSPEQKKRVQELNDIERGLRVQQVFEFRDEVDSQDTTDRFKVYVHLTYRVSRTHQDDLPSSNLNEVVGNLRPRILATLKRVSRRFAITDLLQADDGLQEKLDDALVERTFDQFGLEVLSIMVSCDLNEESRKRYLEIVAQKHSAEMERLKLEGVQQSAEVVSGLIRQGNYAVLAMAVARNEISAEDLYNRLNEQQAQQFKFQMQVLEKFTSGNLLNEKPIYDGVGNIVQIISSSAAGVMVTNPIAQLEAGKENSPREKTGDARDDGK